MPYRLFGHDAAGRPMRPIFSSMASEEDAVASANERGMLVQEVQEAKDEKDLSGFTFVDQNAASRPKERRVLVSGINIPFWDLVWFLVKLSIAAIPATIIVGVIYVFVVGIFAGILSGLR